MASPEAFVTGTGLADLSVQVEEGTEVASLRYFSPGGEFARRAAQAVGAPLPGTQAAISAADGALILAWRSPTETVCVAQEGEALRGLLSGLPASSEGYALSLTGGLTVLRLAGARVAGLLARLGGSASLPAAGESRRSRLADVPVLAIGVPAAAGEVLLLVDRAYAPHLLGWIRETVADFT